MNDDTVNNKGATHRAPAHSLRYRSFVIILVSLTLFTACAPTPTATPLPTATDTPAPTVTVMPTLEATSSDYPTVNALREAVIPMRDRIDLARRYLGIESVPTPPDSAPTREVGEQLDFWISDSASDTVESVTATLRAVGEHIYIWIDNRANISSEDAEAVSEAFDERIYDTVRDLWGSEPTPGIDGDARIYALFTHDLAPGVAGYFASAHLYPNEIQRYSNEHEMIIFNLDTIGTDILDLGVESLLGHEFQHMVRSNVDDNEDTWMDEGFSTFTELYLGYPNELGAIASFLSSPRTQVNTWSENGPRTPHYGASAVFMQYFFERYGRPTIQTLSADPASGMTAVENTVGVEEAWTMLADWALANYFMLPETGFGYYGLPPDVLGATPLQVINSYPYVTSSAGVQYAADYYALENFGGATSLTVQINMATTTPLIDATPTSGQWMMYSNKGDNSDMTLTRAFDLSNVSSAMLNYRVWYYLEENWDYGYVSISGDGGMTWEAIATPYTTTLDPHGNAYGAGYTGQSFVWWQESVSLNAYVGQEILVRFEVITDDSISQPGMVLDDVSIPELGYSEDFENGDGGWVTEGWMRIDNRLPQQAWVQVAQQVGDEVPVSRWLFPDEGQTWSVALEPDASRVVLVVFPFAPMTVVPATYTLSVATE